MTIYNVEIQYLDVKGHRYFENYNGIIAISPSYAIGLATTKFNNDHKPLNCEIDKCIIEINKLLKRK